MNITFSTPRNHHQIHMDAVEVSDLCYMLQTTGRLTFTRDIELGDADNMALVVAGDTFSDVVFFSVNGANMSVDGYRSEIEQKLQCGLNSDTDVMFDAKDVNFKV